MDSLYFVFLAGFALAAIDDYKRQKIHNLIPACLWLLAGLSGQSWALPGAVIAFGVLFLANTLITMKWDVPFFQWADVLILPMFVFGICFIRNKPMVVPFIAAGFFAPLLVSLIKKKRIAVAPYIFLFYLLAGIAWILSP